MTQQTLTVADYIRMGAEHAIVQRIHDVKSAAGKLEVALLRRDGVLQAQVRHVFDALSELTIAIDMHVSAASVEAKLKQSYDTAK